MPITEIIAIAGLAAGAALGLGGLCFPDWASRVVRLQPDPARGGGYSEFRGTYGGLFLTVHLATLILVITTPPDISALIVLPLAAGWLGAAAGRIAALILDRPRLGDISIIPFWMAPETVLGLAIAAPLLGLLG